MDPHICRCEDVLKCHDVLTSWCLSGSWWIYIIELRCAHGDKLRCLSIDQVSDLEKCHVKKETVIEIHMYYTETSHLTGCYEKTYTKPAIFIPSIIIATTLLRSQTYNHGILGTDSESNTTTHKALTHDSSIPDKPRDMSHAQDHSKQSDL
jgi:hypothetical protein